MIELTEDQACQLQAPDKRELVEMAMNFVKEHIQRVYSERTPDETHELLEVAYDRAVEYHITDKALVFKYMVYALSSPALIDGPKVRAYFMQKGKDSNLLAKDYFAVIELKPAAEAIKTQKKKEQALEHGGQN